MPIEEIDKKRPICDTDIWIKSCKYKEIYQGELIFDVYDKIFMSDAVRQELGRVRGSKEPFNGLTSIKIAKNIEVNGEYEDEYKKDFELGLKYFSEENGKRLNIIQSHNEKFFNEKESKALEKEFLEMGIIYDRKENRYKGTKKGLGEKVTLIVAGVLEIPIILSDDNHTKLGANEMINQYPHLKVVDLYNLLNKKYKNPAKVREIKSKINEPIDTTKKALSEIAISSVSSGKPNLKSYKNKFKKSNNK